MLDSRVRANIALTLLRFIPLGRGVLKDIYKMFRFKLVDYKMIAWAYGFNTTLYIDDVCLTAKRGRLDLLQLLTRTCSVPHKTLIKYAAMGNSYISVVS